MCERVRFCLFLLLFVCRFFFFFFIFVVVFVFDLFCLFFCMVNLLDRTSVCARAKCVVTRGIFWTWLDSERGRACL